MIQVAKVPQVLRDHAGDLWGHYVKHPFVVSLKEGTLPRDAFRYYLTQDAKYVAEMQRAVIRAPSSAPLEEAVEVIAAVFGNPERGKEVHERLYSALGITEEEVRGAGFNLVNYAYTRHLHYYASQGWPLFLAASTVDPIFGSGPASAPRMTMSAGSLPSSTYSSGTR